MCIVLTLAWSLAGRTYRFYSETPVFAFGTGLSYSSFDIRVTQPSRQQQCIDATELENIVATYYHQPHEEHHVLKVSVLVENAGPRSGAVSILGEPSLANSCHPRALACAHVLHAWACRVRDQVL